MGKVRKGDEILLGLKCLQEETCLMHLLARHPNCSPVLQIKLILGSVTTLLQV
jgi:hypothetical protein